MISPAISKSEEGSVGGAELSSSRGRRLLRLPKAQEQTSAFGRTSMEVAAGLQTPLPPGTHGLHVGPKAAGGKVSRMTPTCLVFPGCAGQERNSMPLRPQVTEEAFGATKPHPPQAPPCHTGTLAPHLMQEQRAHYRTGQPKSLTASSASDEGLGAFPGRPPTQLLASKPLLFNGASTS